MSAACLARWWMIGVLTDHYMRHGAAFIMKQPIKELANQPSTVLPDNEIAS